MLGTPAESLESAVLDLSLQFTSIGLGSEGYTSSNVRERQLVILFTLSASRPQCALYEKPD